MEQFKTKKALVGYIRSQIQTDKTFCENTVKTIYSRQTSDEVATKDTHHVNGRGFMKGDALKFSDLAIEILKNGSMSEDQFKVASPRMSHYAKQVYRAAVENDLIKKVNKVYEIKGFHKN